MRNLSHLDKFRVDVFNDGEVGDEYNGAFRLEILGEVYFVVASNGGGWEHVSLSHKHKTPSWDMMCAIKDLFFDEEEVVMQLHPKKSEYINNHPHCLHLWRPMYEEIPTPPNYMVGLK